MPLVKAQSALVVEDSAITLARYAALIEFPECGFFGVKNDADRAMGECLDIWSLLQRNTVAKYLAEAQFEIEQEVGYFLSPRYVVGTLADQPLHNDRYVDSQPYHRVGRYLTKWPKVIAAGVRAESDIELDALVDHTTDPAIVGPLATTVTEASEVHVYHPDSEVEIDYSAITLAGGFVTLEIPRCRLVSEASADNPPEGLEHTDVGNCGLSFAPPVTGSFECVVDVKRIYTDPSTNAELVWTHPCSPLCASNGCTDRTQAACEYIRSNERGSLDVRPARFVDDAWIGGSLSCPVGCGNGIDLVRFNYLCGTQSLTPQAEDAILRLAHAKMPDEPCGCDVTQFLWKRDRHIPEVLDRERLNCPFGLSDGAWIAWRFANSMKHYTGSTL